MDCDNVALWAACPCFSAMPVYVRSSINDIPLCCAACAYVRPVDVRQVSLAHRGRVWPQQQVKCTPADLYGLEREKVYSSVCTKQPPPGLAVLLDL